MRGGTANCTVILSEEEIGSPLVRKPDVSVVLNLPSLDKYEKLTKQNGAIVANSSLINRGLQRDDLKNIFIPANEIAEEIGLGRMANMVMIGAMLKLAPVLPIDAVKQALAEHIPDRHRKTLPNNFEAMDRGYKFAEKALAEVAA
jgi:2-oxoglutarate ferredoxin oxidoreductase subunit gamma